MRHLREKTVGASLYADMVKQSLSFEPKAARVSRLQRGSHVTGKRYVSTGREQVNPEFRW